MCKIRRYCHTMMLLFRMVNNRKMNLYDVATFIICIPFYVMIYIVDNTKHKTHRKVNKRRVRTKGGVRKRGRLVCNAVMVYAATTNRHNVTHFDTDAAMVGIDNRASGCFSHKASDFIGELRDCNRVVKGFGGSSTSNVKIGTLKWSWLDDSGKEHTHHIPNSYYSKSGGVRLLSPQHFSQASNDIHGTGTSTNGKRVELFWNGKKDKLTIPLSKQNNVATFHLAPGFNNYDLFCMKAVTPLNDDQHALRDLNPESEKIHENDLPTFEYQQKEWMGGRKQIFDLAERRIENSEDEVERPKRRSLEEEYLLIHQQLGHIHESRMQLMVKHGILPKKFDGVRLPFCASCAYGKQIRKGWRSKTSNNKEEATRPTRPGECISVDQLISPTPGIIAQMTGRLTTKRYTCATVYVDQYSSMSYVHLQKSTDAEETIGGKRSFESYARQHGIKIERYHADNGVFRSHKWTDECRRMGQGLTFAGVGAHHQNGVAERRIRLLQEMTRTLLIHAQSKWPQAISTNLWPYALREANASWNRAPNPRDGDKMSPEQRFTGSPIQTNVKHCVPFGCPTYVLNSKLQERTPFHKWKSRARVGIYIGRSPDHARNIALVMDKDTGLVSPQFHVKYDMAFDTVQQGEITCNWKIKAGFVRVVRTATRVVSATDNTTELPLAQDHRNDGGQHDQLPVEADGFQQNDMSQGELSDVAAVQATCGGCMDETIQEIYAFDTETQYTDDLVVAKAQCDPDTMYYHQAMQQPDRDEFKAAMTKEVEDQFSNGNFEIVLRKSVPKGSTILPAVWQMRRKRDIITGAIRKYKARLNIDGSRMKKGRDYDLTYAPVATWNAIRLVLTMVMLKGWHTVQLDYVAAFPQAPIERDLYMEIPKGTNINGRNKKDYVLRLKRNLYGQKQAGRVWNKYLVSKLTSKAVGFVQSKYDECVFYKDDMVYILYTDDSIIAGPDRVKIEETIELIKQVGLEITVEGDLQDFLGINIERRNDGTTHMTQPLLIQKILKDLRLHQDNVNKKETPMASSRILHRHQKSDPHDGSFHYRSLVGKLNYLEKATRPDIAYAVHQCARFSSDPKVEHGAAIKWIGRYLKGTATKGTIYQPDETKGLEVHVDADFVGNWDINDVENSATAKSRHGYVISYANCPICWKSQIQPHIALSSCEAEYIGLSAALRETIPIMNLVQEMQSHGIIKKSTDTKVHCKVFEDNVGAVEMAREHKYRPRTKHMLIKYHHFRQYVDDGSITIHSINTHDQRADILTKPLNERAFVKHRKAIQGW